MDGRHQSKTVAGESLAGVAAGYVVAAVFAGRLGDRFGLARVIFFASFLYGTGFLVGGLAQQWHSWYLGLIGLVSIAGGTVMTLAWGLLYKIVPEQHRGAVSGLATTTKGIGLLAGATPHGRSPPRAPTWTRPTDTRSCGPSAACRCSRRSRCWSG